MLKRHSLSPFTEEIRMQERKKQKRRKTIDYGALDDDRTIGGSKRVSFGVVDVRVYQKDSPRLKPLNRIADIENIGKGVETRIGKGVETRGELKKTSISLLAASPLSEIVCNNNNNNNQKVYLQQSANNKRNSLDNKNLSFTENIHNFSKSPQRSFLVNQEDGLSLMKLINEFDDSPYQTQNNSNPIRTQDDSMEFTADHGGIIKAINIDTQSKSQTQDDSMEFTADHGGIIKTITTDTQSKSQDDSMDFTADHSIMGSLGELMTIDENDEGEDGDSNNIDITAGLEDQVRNDIESILKGSSADRTCDLPDPLTFGETTSNIAAIYRHILAENKDDDTTHATKFTLEDPTTPNSNSRPNNNQQPFGVNNEMVTPRIDRKLDIDAVLAAVTPVLSSRSFKVRDFLCLAGIKFFDDTLKRTESLVVNQLAPFPSDTVEQLKECWIANPELQSMQQACTSLTSINDQFQTSVGQLESELNTHNPDIFRQLRLANPEESAILQSKFQEIKNWCKLKAKIDWLEFRKKLSIDIFDHLKTNNRILSNDSKILDSLLSELNASLNHIHSASDPLIINLNAGVQEQASVINTLDTDLEVLKEKSSELDNSINKLIIEEKNLDEKLVSINQTENSYSKLKNQTTDLQDDFSVLNSLVSWRIQSITSEQCIITFFDSFKLAIAFDSNNTNIISSCILEPILHQYLSEDAPFVQALLQKSRLNEIIIQCQTRKDIKKLVRSLEQTLGRLHDILIELNDLRTTYNLTVDCSVTDEDPVIEIFITSHVSATNPCQLLLSIFPNISNINSSVKMDFIVTPSNQKEIESKINNCKKNYGWLTDLCISIQKLVSSNI